MDVKELIQRANEEIVELISHYIDIKRKGRSYEACCPFHQEKTPSFIVTPGLGIYKCFGCGKSGDAIDFVQNFEGVDFKEACKIAADKLNIDFSFKEDNQFDEAKYKHQESLRYVCEIARDFYMKEFQKSATAQNFIKKRNFYNEETCSIPNEFCIGYAPKNNAFLKYAKDKGIKNEILLEAGLIVENENKELYDYFRERIMFPISDSSGRCIGFTGRYFGKENKPKYFNTKDTSIFTKGNNLYGLSIARETIKKESCAYIVEGNFDTIRLHTIGITNAIAPCGTALTDSQIELLSKYTKNVTLIYDGDNAGLNATEKNARLFIKHKMNVNVVILPEKEDPDTFFDSKETFDTYITENQSDFIYWLVNKNVTTCSKNPAFKSRFIRDIASLICSYDDDILHGVYVEGCGNILGPVKSWKDAVTATKKAPNTDKHYINKDITLADLEKHGFFESNNCYYFPGNKHSPERRCVSNFVLIPIFHIESSINAKRIYELRNDCNQTRILEISQKEFNMSSTFRMKVESFGNFWWNGTDGDLATIKRFLYANVESCTEITQLGWQKDAGIWAWGNGLSVNGEFLPIDDTGIVRHSDRNYYLPARSKLYANEPNLFTFERNFSHIESHVSLRDYVRHFIQVHGENGRIAFCYYLSCLFRDVIVNRWGVFPLLNLFGPKGSGKSACAESLVQLFGRAAEAPNLFSITKAAMGEHIAAACNALCVLDEYRNDLDVEKREILKSIWGGTGRSKMNMEKDKKRETTSVEQGVVVCGQQMADADPALPSRFLFLSFNNDTHTYEERKNFIKLKDIERRGITHITNRLLRLRTKFIERYDSAVEETKNAMMKIPGTTDVMDRILNNWLMIISTYTALEEYLELPWDRTELINLATEKMITQSSEGQKNDDLGQFWNAIQTLAYSSYLYEDGDYKIDTGSSFVRFYTKDGAMQRETIPFAGQKQLFILRPDRALSLYKSQMLKEGNRPLPSSTLLSYLVHSKAFICNTTRCTFKQIDPKTGIQVCKEGKKMRTTGAALVFDYEQLPLHLTTLSEDDALAQEREDKRQAEEAATPTVKEQQLPFTPQEPDESNLPF
ncbi:MAG: DNA primase [Marinifilaceae bacterium]|nr:DNA primase [Marinifilaceae bacterium]